MMMMGARAIEQLARRPLVKVLTRLILYGLVAVFAWAAGENAVAEDQLRLPAEAIAEALASLAFLALAVVLDRWHHRKDRAEPPPPAAGATDGLEPRFD